MEDIQIAKISKIGLASLSTLLILCPIKSAAQESNEYVVTIANEQLHFVAQPELGYVVKSESAPQAMDTIKLMSDKSGAERVLTICGRGRKNYLILQRRSKSTDTYLDMVHLIQSNRVTYVAPLFSLNDEWCAIIPEIIIRLKDEKFLAQLESLCQESRCRIVRNLLYSKIEYLVTPDAQNAEQVLIAVEILNEADFVEWAWPNIAFEPKLCGQPVADEPNRVEPNDEYFHNQWHLDAIRAPEAWSYTTGDPNIVVAVLDDGVDINHPDLVNNIWVNPNEIPDNDVDDDENGFIDDVYGWDFVRDDNDPNPDDPNDAHGTACAGLIAAHGNNNIGVTGIAWNCTIMPIRIAPSSATKCFTLTEPVDGLRYAAAQGADVISNSWGITLHCEPIHSAIKDVTRSGGIGRNGRGCIVFCASGNWEDGGRVVFPANCPEVIAVGAIDQNDVVWDYSGHGIPLDIVAPSGEINLGGNLWTTDITDTNGYNSRDPNIFDYTDKMGGTSGACPIAAGVAALIISLDQNLTNMEVRRILLRSAIDLGSRCWDEHYGHGRIDAYAAVTMALNLPPASTLCVDDDAPDDPGPGDPKISDPLEDGSDEHPFDAIQNAINNAIDGDTVIVTPGIYTGEGNRNIQFYGRIITVRSQDGPESCIIDCETKGRGFTFYSRDTNSVVEGFNVINGKAAYGSGGGMYIQEGSPTVRNCIFKGNVSERNGGGMCIEWGSPIVRNCTFIGNVADAWIYGDGGGMYILLGKPLITNCTFIGNSTGRKGNGGGICSHDCGPTIKNCIFSGNLSNDDGDGGGIANVGSWSTITGCIFTGNSTDGRGGGMYNSGCSPTVANCTFIGNLAEEGGGIYNHGRTKRPTITNCLFAENSAIQGGGGLYIDDCSPKVSSCIFWGDMPDEIFTSSGKPEISYNDVQYGWPFGEGNINVDPLFADPDNGDYHLKSQAGRWDPGSGSWVIDDITSPCIDAGDPNSPVGDEPEPNGGRINMGVYGGTAEASKSPVN